MKLAIWILSITSLVLLGINIFYMYQINKTKKEIEEQRAINENLLNPITVTTPVVVPSSDITVLSTNTDIPVVARVRNYTMN